MAVAQKMVTGPEAVADPPPRNAEMLVGKAPVPARTRIRTPGVVLALTYNYHIDDLQIF